MKRQHFHAYALLALGTAAGAPAAQVQVCKTCPNDTIQKGIDAAAPGQTVQVTDMGATTYTENIDYTGKNIVVEVGPGAGPITLRPATAGVPTVTMTGGLDRTAVLRGFTITGNLTASAVDCSGSAPVIQANTITSNGSVGGVPAGGGIFGTGAAPLILENMIAFNTSRDFGGGVYLSGSAGATGETPTLTGNTFRENFTRLRGGGAALFGLDAVLVSENEFDSNIQDSLGTGEPHCGLSFPLGGGGMALVDAGTGPHDLIDNEIVDNFSTNYGGGILCLDASPTILATGAQEISGNGAECNGGGIALIEDSDASVLSYTMEGNLAFNRGAGIAAMFSSDALVDGCSITDGVVLVVDFDGHGAGIYSEDSAPVIRYCAIERNRVTMDPTYLSYGGGISVLDGPDPGDPSATIRSCTLKNNMAPTAGAGIYIGEESPLFGPLPLVTVKKNHVEANGTHPGFPSLSPPLRGGGIAVEDTEAKIIRNTVLKNLALTEGAGIHASSVGSSSSIHNNMVVKNKLEDEFGVLQVGTGAGLWFSGSPERLIHNTIARNEGAAGTVAAGMFVSGGTAEVWNTIAWNNSGGTDIDGFPTVYFSDVQDPNGWIDGGGNISLPPQFVSPASDDFHIRLSSPCIDRGDQTVPGMTARDIDGDDRVFDDDTEMGADEVDVPEPIQVR